MRELKEGICLPTILNKPVCVLGEIGQGVAKSSYRAEYEGDECVLIWMNPLMDGRDAYRRRHQIHRIIQGPPSPAFSWPLDVTVEFDGSYGCVVPRVPDAYVFMWELMRRPRAFPSLRQAIDACLNVVTLFDDIHCKGYRWENIDDGSILIDPDTGNIIVLPDRCEMGAGGGSGSFIFPNPTFMAPELVSGASPPTIASDLYTLPVFIFYLLMLQPPMIGARDAGSGTSGGRVDVSDLRFVFEQESEECATSSRLCEHASFVWQCLPTRMKDMFRQTFSHESLHDCLRRPSETQWARELTLLRSQVVACRCEDEAFLDETKPVRCEKFGAWEAR